MPKPEALPLHLGRSDGVATLSGFVWEPRDIYRARDLTARVPGVISVVNQMEINRFGEL
jgi:osmotically-inducible protein OsmY